MIHLNKALLVDDDEVVTALMRFALRNSGLDLQETNEASRALALLESERFDVLFTDFRLGTFSGLELALKARERWSNIVVVLMTAAEENEFEWALRKGLIDWLIVKPFSLPDVEKVMNFLRNRDELEKQCVS